jgi:hypothetical protein
MVEPKFSENIYELEEKEFRRLLDLPDDVRVIDVTVIDNDRTHRVVVTTHKGLVAPEIKKRPKGGY